MKAFKISIALFAILMLLVTAGCGMQKQPNNNSPNSQQNRPEDAEQTPSTEAPGNDTETQNKPQQGQTEERDVSGVNQPDQQTQDDSDKSIDEISKLLPARTDYQWSYHGFAEYGHRMVLESISKEDNAIVYSISGKVDDMSGGESKQDLSFSVIYTVKPGVLIQNKTGRAMMDTDFKDLELIRAPLRKGNSWLQKIAKEDGTEITLKSTITDIREENGQKIYTVIYEDTQSEYYEKREIKEGVGILSYEKLYMDPNGNFPVGYYIYYPGTGYKNKLEIDAYPPKLDTHLRYFGLAEYGHVGVLKKISSTSEDAIYEFQGKYQDGSGIDDKFTRILQKASSL